MREDAIVNYLEGFITEKRKQRLNNVLAERTGHLAVVLENIYQSHNASAVLRSCDCFGVQNVHFIENRNKMKVNEEVAMGSGSWLSIHRHNKGEHNTKAALRELKKSGYRIVVTSPHKQSHTPETLPVTEKTALVFGTELEGATQEAIDQADDFLAVPMHGFTESFNVSVCTAICLYDLVRRIRATVPQWQLSEPERSQVYLAWLMASVDHSEAIVKDFLNKKKVGG